MKSLRKVAGFALAMMVGAQAFAETNEPVEDGFGYRATAASAQPSAAASANDTQALSMARKDEKAWRVHFDYYPGFGASVVESTMDFTSFGVSLNAPLPVFVGTEFSVGKSMWFPHPDYLPDLKDLAWDYDVIDELAHYYRLSEWHLTLSAGWEDRVFINNTLFLEGRAGLRWTHNFVKYKQRGDDNFDANGQVLPYNTRHCHDADWGLILNPRVGARLTDWLELSIGYRWDFYKLKMYRDCTKEYCTLSATIVL